MWSCVDIGTPPVEPKEMLVVPTPSEPATHLDINPLAISESIAREQAEPIKIALTVSD